MLKYSEKPFLMQSIHVKKLASGVCEGLKRKREKETLNWKTEAEPDRKDGGKEPATLFSDRPESL